MSQLGRREPTDWKHVERYPLTADTTPAKPVPVTLGINWYTNFDSPQRDATGRYWIGRGSLGSIRGGHCVCVPFDPAKDPATWWSFYNQGQEGACVGFGSSRMMSLLNRFRYDARWLWNEAKKVDGFPDTNPGDNNGTTVRAAMDVLRTEGHVKQVSGRDLAVSLAQGISANRWATSAQDVLSVLQNPTYAQLGAVPILNSWGKDYPHVVWMPLATLDRVIRESGEATMVTDR
jgi:hypothetical protein